jgi:hypothetical protein
VFTGNPYPWSVNGAIWTLPMELLGYGLVLVAGLVVLAGAGRWVVVVALGGMVYADSVLRATFEYHGAGGSLLLVPIGSTVSFLVPFVLGVVLHAYRDKIPLRPWAALVLFAAYLALSQVRGRPVPAGDQRVLRRDHARDALAEAAGSRRAARLRELRHLHLGLPDPAAAHPRRGAAGVAADAAGRAGLLPRRPAVVGVRRKADAAAAAVHPAAGSGPAAGGRAAPAARHGGRARPETLTPGTLTP